MLCPSWKPRVLRDGARVIKELSQPPNRVHSYNSLCVSVKHAVKLSTPWVTKGKAPKDFFFCRMSNISEKPSSILSTNFPYQSFKIMLKGATVDPAVWLSCSNFRVEILWQRVGYVGGRFHHTLVFAHVLLIFMSAVFWYSLANIT